MSKVIWQKVKFSKSSTSITNDLIKQLGKVGVTDYTEQEIPGEVKFLVIFDKGLKTEEKWWIPEECLEIVDPVTVMQKCCGRCPFSRKNTLFIHPDRALDFAESATNPYNDFVCHKTGVVIEEGTQEGDIVRGPKSLTCAGFHALQSFYTGKPAEITLNYEDHFSDPQEMEEHHAEEWYKTDGEKG